tara:strand:- start:231 stop:431 length:201 start_codon:yes stop_codon:yes gene_type:complete
MTGKIITGKYIVNFDIYFENPYGKQELKCKKGDVVEIVEHKDRNVWEEQFITNSGKWFKKNQITKI